MPAKASYRTANTGSMVEGQEILFRTIVECGRAYGWRISELLGMKVKQVDLLPRVIRLDPGTTNNSDGREVFMTDGCIFCLGLCGRQGARGCRIHATQWNPGPFPPRLLGKGLHHRGSRTISLR
jgi:hypothetical protein